MKEEFHDIPTLDIKRSWSATLLGVRGKLQVTPILCIMVG